MNSKKPAFSRIANQIAWFRRPPPARQPFERAKYASFFFFHVIRACHQWEAVGNTLLENGRSFVSTIDAIMEDATEGTVFVSTLRFIKLLSLMRLLLGKRLP